MSTTTTTTTTKTTAMASLVLDEETARTWADYFMGCDSFRFAYEDRRAGWESIAGRGSVIEGAAIPELPFEPYAGDDWRYHSFREASADFRQRDKCRDIVAESVTGHEALFYGFEFSSVFRRHVEDAFGIKIPKSALETKFLSLRPYGLRESDIAHFDARELRATRIGIVPYDITDSLSVLREEDKRERCAAEVAVSVREITSRYEKAAKFRSRLRGRKE